jgi:hypothetical protein
MLAGETAEQLGKDWLFVPLVDRPRAAAKDCSTLSGAPQDGKLTVAPAGNPNTSRIGRPQHCRIANVIMQLL